jgi:hypothetical protein
MKKRFQIKKNKSKLKKSTRTRIINKKIQKQKMKTSKKHNNPNKPREKQESEQKM